METEIEKSILIYMGQRHTNDDKISQQYWDIELKISYGFSQKLVGLEMIGNQISTEIKGSTFKKSKMNFDNKRDFPELEITNWTVEHRASMEYGKQLSEAKYIHYPPPIPLLCELY